MAKKTKKGVRMLVTYYELAEPRFEAGKFYELNEETQRRLALGDAEPGTLTIDDPEFIPAPPATDGAAAAGGDLLAGTDPQP